jgi:Ni,Fe-hydrogenase III small subunit
VADELISGARDPVRRLASPTACSSPGRSPRTLALQKPYDAVPDPKIVIAVGACAISGGAELDHPEVAGGADAVVPVERDILGCPPHPDTILEGLIGLIGWKRSRATSLP